MTERPRSSMQDDLLIHRAMTELPSGATIHDRNGLVANYVDWLHLHAEAERGGKYADKIEDVAYEVRRAARRVELFVNGVPNRVAKKQAYDEFPRREW